MKEKKSIWLQTVKQMNIGVGVCGVGFLLYILLLMLEMEQQGELLVTIHVEETYLLLQKNQQLMLILQYGIMFYFQ